MKQVLTRAMTRRTAAAHSKAAGPMTTLRTQRGKNLTLIGAMALRGLVGEMTFPGATDASSVSDVSDTGISTQQEGSRACVVMDNLAAHKVTGIREAIVAVGATLVYLSKEVRRGKLPPATLRPYSPDFSPIENCWSKVKEFLRALFCTNLCRVRHRHH